MSHTCVSCALEFPDVPTQRGHMKSDWHRYNLKRRVAQLPAISEAVFNEKIASMAQEDAPEDRSSKKQVTKKDVRRQQKEALQQQRRELLAKREALQEKFKGLNLDNNETTEPKTTEKGPAEPIYDQKSTETPAEPASDAPKDVEQPEISQEEQLLAEKLANRVEIPVTTCLFCPMKKQSNFATLDENLDHMFKAHGLYIPEKKYLVDPAGLITYLGEKLGLGNVCLVCSYQGKNLEAVREHMFSKRHMKIPYENEDEKLEISDFYDFTSSYGNYTQDSADGNNEEWEDVSGESAGEEDDEDEIPEDPLIDMGTELILPSGAVVGHRSMARYYKQNFPPERILSEGQGTVIAAETRHFAAPAQRQELQMAKRAWSSQKKREDTNDRRAQKFINNQPHFRDPLLQ
ncbi:hypothetical protein OXX80_002778 [Metschnikowia pulcherrima]